MKIVSNIFSNVFLHYIYFSSEFSILEEWEQEVEQELDEELEVDCTNVACFEENCADGSRAPVPLGRCCPDRAMCLVFSNDIEDWAL